MARAPSSDFEGPPPVGTPEFERFIQGQARSSWDRACALWIVRIPLALFVVMFAWLTIDDIFFSTHDADRVALGSHVVFATVFCLLGAFIVIRGRLPRFDL